MRNRYLKSILILLFLLSMFAVGIHGQVLLEKEWRFVDLAPANLAADGAKAINILPYVGGRNNDDLQIPTGSRALDSAVVAENLNINQGTIEIYLKWNKDNAATGTNYLFDHRPGGAGSNNNRVSIVLQSNRILFDVYDNSGTNHRVGSGVISNMADRWVHVVARWDYQDWSAIEIWLDGSVSGNIYNNNSGTSNMGAVAGSISPGMAFDGTLQINGSIKYHIRSRPITAAEVTALYAGGDGHLDSFVVGPDTAAMDQFTDDSTGITYNPGQLAISSISTVTLTLTLAADTKLVAGDEVAVYDDDNPPNIVYTGVGSVSGVTVVVDDSCAAVSGTNKTITRNLMADGNMEIGNTGAFAAGDGATTLSKPTVEIFKDAQSLKVLNGDGTQAFGRQTITTIANADYLFFGRFFAPDTPNGASQLVDVDLTAALGVTVTQAGLSAGWNDVEFAFEAADASTTVDLGSGSVTNTEFGYWDDVRVEALVAGDALDADTYYTIWYDVDLDVTGAQWSGLGSQATDVKVGDLYVRNDKAAASVATKGDGLVPINQPFFPAEWQ